MAHIDLSCPYCGKRHVQSNPQVGSTRQYYCVSCQASSPVFDESEADNVLFWTKDVAPEVILEGGILDAVDVPAHVTVKLYDRDISEEDIDGETPSGEPCQIRYL